MVNIRPHCPGKVMVVGTMLVVLMGTRTWPHGQGLWQLWCSRWQGLGLRRWQGLQSSDSELEEESEQLLLELEDDEHDSEEDQLDEDRSQTGLRTWQEEEELNSEELEQLEEEESWHWRPLGCGGRQ